MLRKRSRPVASSKQTIVSDHNNNNNNLASASTEKPNKPTSFLFNPPRILKDFFLSRDQSAQQATPMISPISVLDTKPLFPSLLPTSAHLWIDNNKIQNPQTLPSATHSWEHPGIGLALIDNGEDDEEEKSPHVVPTNTTTTTMTKTCKERSKLVVFGSQLKIQIPQSPSPPIPLPLPLPPFPPSSSPNSPMEFGIKTPKSNLLGVIVNSPKQEEEYYKEKKRLSMKDMESSEDYTCVISHGPNPKTTHIFGNCIVESCFSGVSNTDSASTSTSRNGFSSGFKRRVDTNFFSPRNTDSPTSGDSSFLSFCHHCKCKIGQGKDIYMYRGERAFCSQECRGQEMLYDGIES